MGRSESRIRLLDSNLLVDTLLLLFYLLFEFLDSGVIWGSAVCLENLNVPDAFCQCERRGIGSAFCLLFCILISKRCNLLLFDFVITVLLPVLFPVLTCCRWLLQVSVASMNECRVARVTNHDDFNKGMRIMGKKIEKTMQIQDSTMKFVR